MRSSLPTAVRLLAAVALLGLLALTTSCGTKEDPKIAVTNGASATGSSPYGTGTASGAGTTIGPASRPSSADTSPIPSIKGSVAPTAGNAITIQDYAFVPPELVVKVGATVTWTNNETDPPVEHWVKTMPGQVGDLDSGKLAPGATYSKTFGQAGSYSYYCEIHNIMKAKVTVAP